MRTDFLLSECRPKWRKVFAGHPYNRKQMSRVQSVPHTEKWLMVVVKPNRPRNLCEIRVWFFYGIGNVHMCVKMSEMCEFPKDE